MDYANYCVKGIWNSQRKGVVSADKIEPKIAFSASPEFRGESGLWTPEHFLLAAVASCFVVTIYATAERSQMDFLDLENVR